ncbi:hypothetical protein H9X96_13605 [Pedobacter sp. N36a]|uniref:hypothetical protein n=1 Tax=Pedobacter sp. N36a TaxID=2767996 RepID=UPI0016570E9C|nr:hypothetical protein [Pedobacter sp. N36a]MBC8986811.1 hypothetical protein [Pedobacter sp. N36a]
MRLSCHKDMLHLTSRNKTLIVISRAFFVLLLIFYSSCSSINELASKKSSQPGLQLRICAISPRVGSYRMLTLIDDQKNHYSLITKDLPYHLKIGDEYPGQ